MRLFTLCLFCLLLLSSCAIPSSQERANAIGQSHGFTQHIFSNDKDPKISLFGLEKKGQGSCLHVYIEGDGFAYINPTTPSLDPTPKFPQALWLAVHDTSKNPIVYLARPGQYLNQDLYPCPQKYWTYARAHNDILDLYDTCINTAKQRLSCTTCVLTGFSGGGSICVLLAAQRKDVLALATCGGNLDFGCFSKTHELSPLDAVDPITKARSIAHIPQIHYAGGKDTVVPLSCLSNFCEKLPKGSLRIIPDFTHQSPWYTAFSYDFPIAKNK